MAQKQTPGVYVEESSSFPPSVAGVATAIPAFIGYTACGPTQNPVSVSSLLEYQKLFGEGPTLSWAGGSLKGQEFALYDSIRLFYDNGGAECYVISLGGYTATNASATAYKTAIDELEKIGEVTLLVFPDAATLLASSALADVQQYALQHCHDLGGRFTILDLSPVVKKPKTEKDPEMTLKDLTSVVDQFRTGIGTNYLCYGAAYYPFLKTSYEKEIKVSVVLEALGAKEGKDTELNKAYSLLNSTDPEKDLKVAALLPKIDKYAEKLAELQEAASIVPPSGAIAGLYAATDSRAGVWQAPANISIASVCGLTELISDAQQDKMNVADNGKSVNAIRFFKGKGYLVWGSRTLLGNDREWKYVNVRRFFNYVEQSLKNSTAWAVFQPNDANTWIKIQCQIESFLTTLWRDGALAGATPDKAFFVEVGLGKTMDSNDILDGNLKVRIGLAAVRPAEFIILEFSHKVQE
ncbi:MAG: phage tail sheath family protein [Bacteroidales bacterium]|nr:phage tail sheath family protein [Bacteroidales bacterium]